jgi:hypothetical protein
MDVVKEKHSKLEKCIVYSTGALFLDVIVGQAFIGKPLHQSLGIKFPDYIQTTEDVLLGLGIAYSIIKPYFY